MQRETLTGRAAEVLFGQVAMTHRFVVEIDSTPYNFGSWTKVSGLQVEWDAHAYRPCELSTDVIVPGAVKYQQITLARAACSDTKIVKKWLSDVPNQLRRCGGALHILDFTGQPMLTWEMRQLFPVSWAISGFDATSAQPAIEELKLAHTGFLDNDRRTP